MAIPRDALETAMYGAVRLAATRIPPDVEAALRRARDEETEPLARQHLDASLENAQRAAAGQGLVCGDTGFPLFFAWAGAATRVEGGFESLWQAAAAATARATRDSLLRPTMVDPLSRDNPGDNVGPGMPRVELRFRGQDDGLTLVAVPKGGGSEIFGTAYRMLYPVDGVAGVLKFVFEAIRDGCYAGKICPPAIMGVGLGGTADLCMKLAKEAALLRAVGSVNPDPELDALEGRLTTAVRSLGIGPMGARGVHAVIGIHIAKAMTHTAALPVAVNAQCLVGRRWQARIDAHGTVSYSGRIGEIGHA